MDSGERGMNPVAMTHQSSERILAEPADQTSDRMFSSPVCYQLTYWFSHFTLDPGNQFCQTMDYIMKK